jgi:hypothetical protein
MIVVRVVVGVWDRAVEQSIECRLLWRGGIPNRSTNNTGQLLSHEIKYDGKE